jgi:FSR family fosmidomycin resistance protein-like MFS transporter
MAGLGSALLGRLADATDIDTVFRVCSFLPLLGLMCWYLPDQKRFA